MNAHCVKHTERHTMGGVGGSKGGPCRDQTELDTEFARKLLSSRSGPAGKFETFCPLEISRMCNKGSRCSTRERQVWVCVGWGGGGGRWEE